MPRGTKETPADHLPLGDSKLQVLLALGEGEMHGYALLRAIRGNTVGRVSLSASTLYSVIKRLEEGALIEESDRRPDPRLDDDRRRYFRLTRLGRAVCLLELDRLERLVARGRATVRPERVGS